MEQTETKTAEEKTQELIDELKTIIKVTEEETKEDGERINAMRLLMPEVDGLITYGEYLGKMEIAKKVIKTLEQNIISGIEAQLA